MAVKIFYKCLTVFIRGLLNLYLPDLHLIQIHLPDPPLVRKRHIPQIAPRISTPLSLQPQVLECRAVLRQGA